MVKQTQGFGNWIFRKNDQLCLCPICVKMMIIIVNFALDDGDIWIAPERHNKELNGGFDFGKNMAECALMVQVTIRHFSYFLSESESHIFSHTYATMDWASQKVGSRLPEARRLVQTTTGGHNLLLFHRDCRREPIQWILKRNPEIGNPCMTHKICC